jgi:hypothetical protein
MSSQKEQFADVFGPTELLHRTTSYKSPPPPNTRIPKLKNKATTDDDINAEKTTPGRIPNIKGSSGKKQKQKDDLENQTTPNQTTPKRVPVKERLGKKPTNDKEEEKEN